jgi:hypothetical protein
MKLDHEEREETRQRLMAAIKYGLKIVICGESARGTSEIVDYRIFTAGWRNILLDDPAGKIALEIDGGDKVKMWRKVEPSGLPESVVMGDEVIIFRGRKLFLEESAKPLVKVDGSSAGKISYAVYTNKSHTIGVCLEEWPEGLEAYSLEREIDLLDIDIVYL